MHVCPKKTMKTIIIVYAFLLALSAGNRVFCQTPLSTNHNSWDAYNCTVKFSGDTIHLINTSETSAFLWAKGLSFANGTIELDIKGKDVRGESFVGIAFHGVDHNTYDAVYFRPFNFREPERKDRAVQYISKPDHDWDVLREKHPGKYEHAIVPDTDPNGWFHVKMELRDPYVSVYVNGSGTATLTVTQLSNRNTGLLGLWIDCREGWFRNVVIKSRKE